MSIYLGYATDNIELRKDHIFTNRTARISTILEKGVDYIIDLARKNIEDLYKIIKWNHKNNIRFYRVSSGLCPHITNEQLLDDNDKLDYKKMVYDVNLFADNLKTIGSYATKNNIRLTFHPDPFISIGTSNKKILIKNTRELYFHTLIMELMGLDLNSTMTIHGGGVYGDKEKSMKTWVRNFNKLPAAIKKRIALENDEYSYSVQDVLYMSSRVNKYIPNTGSVYSIPIVFDIFHYYCYNKTIELKYLDKQPPMSLILPNVVESWGNRFIKMHISEQHADKIRGAHSDYVHKIPSDILNFPHDYKIPLYLMIEAKAKELALFKLRELYKNKKIY